MKPSHAITLMQHYLTVGIPVMLWGKPGIGKSEITYQCAEWYFNRLNETGRIAHAKVHAGMTGEELTKTIILALKNPVHLSGLPDMAKTPTGSKTVYTKPDIMIDETDPQVLLFCDEIDTAPPSTQAAAYGLIKDGVIGDFRLPSYVRRIGAGNGKKFSNASMQMPLPMKNRLAHLDIDYDNESWINWAVDHSISDVLIAWAMAFPQLMSVMPGDTVNISGNAIQFDRDANAFPSPRTYAMLNKAMPYPAEVEELGIASLLGNAVASQFVGFMRVFRNLPNMQDVLRDPMSARVPSDVGARWATIAALVNHVNAMNVANAITYVERFEDAYGNVQSEFVMLLLELAKRHEQDVMRTSAYSNALATYSHVG